MHYVKSLITNGIESAQIACIELHGAPNAATEGAVGVLGMDVTSPTREIYKCTAVNGSIYTWELLATGGGGSGAITTVNGVPLQIFVGTKAEYNALLPTVKEKVFAIITDDTTLEDLKASFLSASGLNGTSAVASGQARVYPGVNGQAFYHAYLEDPSGTIRDFGIIWWDGVNSVVSPMTMSSFELAEVVDCMCVNIEPDEVVNGVQCGLATVYAYGYSNIEEDQGAKVWSPYNDFYPDSAATLYIEPLMNVLVPK